MIEARQMETALTLNGRAGMAERTAAEIEDPDVLLMLRFKKGDTEAFELLFSRHTRAIINFAYRFVRNRESAEELAQEVFLRVYEGAAGYQAQAKFTTWLYRIATNVCLNEIRKPQFRAQFVSEAPDHPREGEEIFPDRAAGREPDRHLERQAIGRAIAQAMAQIPDNQRIAFSLNKYQELSYADVADVMKLSEKAVKSLIHRAKETLAEKLRPLLPELWEL
jgi:RNA polymerase sigma-70 factor, ECF subfamily